MRLFEPRTLIGLAITAVIGALMLPFIYYSVVRRLAPSPPIAAASHAPPLVGDAIWARAGGGAATELKAINPINMGKYVLCSEQAQRERDETLRRISRAQCSAYLPALAGMEHLADVHLRDAGLASPFRRGHARLVTTIWLTRSWTKAELVDTLAERGEFGGARFRGFEAAAHGYFGRSAAQLTLPQAAMVAALLGDRRADPWCNPAATAAMRHRVLEAMRDNNAVDEQAYTVANTSELGLIAPPANHQSCKG